MDTSTMTMASEGGGTPKEIPMGGDMSAARTGYAYIGKAKTFSVSARWPASTGDDKVSGSFAFYTNATNSDDAWAVIAECSDAAFVAAQPDGSGDAGSFTIEGVETGGHAVKVVYTPVSGGAGVTPTVEIFAK